MTGFLYNITIAIDRQCEAEWRTWMTHEQIPFMQQTGLFTETRFFRVVSDDDPGTSSYCVQLMVDRIEKLNTYLAGPSKTFMAALQGRYADRHAAFMTLLESAG